MKTKSQKNIIIVLVLSLCLIFQINALSYTYQDIVQENSEFAKVCTLKDGNVLALSSAINSQQFFVSKWTNKGRVIFRNSTINVGYTADAQLAQVSNSDTYILAQHNKQDVAGHESKENLLTFKGQNTLLKSTVRNNTLYQKTALVSLKNGNVFAAGIHYISSFGAETRVDASVYNPTSGQLVSGISFTAHGKYLSCYEHKDNEVACAYVSYEDVFVSKIKIKYIKVESNTLVPKDYIVVKNFYTEYNFLKAIAFDGVDTLLLFQTGNAKPTPKYGNEGTRLFFYQFELDLASADVNVKRYEYLYPNCLYREDPEDFNADIAVLSPKRIYAVCETALNKFRGFIIYPDKEDFDEFYFNNFDADNVKNPVFTKFDQSLAIFYTHITVHYNKRVAYHLMNYPDCFQYRNYRILLPRGFVKELDFEGKVFLNNPYPASRASEEVKFRFNSYNNMTIKNLADGSQLQPNVDYSSSLSLQILTKELVGDYELEYTATRVDPLDGLILGRTCSVSLNTPECLEQCESCTKKGTDKHHFCLGCKVGKPFYEEEDPDAVNEGYGKPHNCQRCNVSCSSCYGPFLLRPVTTTNCIKCDYKNNYFHFEDDLRTCISNETKKYWEGIIGSAIYIDKTPGPNKKEEWRWRRCHSNCAECFGPGDEDNNNCTLCKAGLYFFCNQTDGDGIPGSCHKDCVNNGFYATKDEKDRDKCCPCLDHCKECKNETICDKCYQPFLLTPDHTECNETCGYCLAEDRALGECVNCKTRYKTPRYTLNKTCVYEIPFIESIKRYHHIVDDECNLLHGCKEGCYKCDPWYTDKCTLCNASYYKEDFFNITPQPDTFRCFNKTTCQGVTPYKHDETLRIGGVPILLNGENVCLNCRLRNNSYRLPEDKFYCGNKIDRTFVDIDDYNKLSYCYFRCKSCDYWGNSMVMNCSECRDGAYYKPLVQIGNYYNCYRKAHKCGIFPYYHDYDLAESLGKEEDNCGEDCDVCLYNFTCTETFPYFVFETHECVEYCPLSDLLNNACGLNNTRAGVLLLMNPFGLKNPYDYLNSSVELNQVISSQFFEYVIKSYNLDVKQTKKDINNYLGNGQIYNLPESKIILGNNISIEISSVRLELEKIAKLLSGDKTVNTQVSAIDLSQCQQILKEKYGLKQEEDLLLLKGDFLQQLSELYLSNQVEYQLFSTSIGAFLPLSPCKEQGSKVTVTNPFNSSNLFGSYQFKTASVADNGYNAFDTNSPFYNDICTPFTNENGNDVLIDERRTDYFNENYNLCEKGCKFIGYNETIKMYTCECQIKGGINDEISYEQTPMEIPEDFFKKQAGYSNIKVFKCASQVFSSQGQKMNFGSYVLLACFASLVTIFVLYILKGGKALDKEFDKLEKIKGKNKKTESVPEKANPPKGNKNEDKEVQQAKNNYDILIQPSSNTTNVVKDIVYRDDELNSAEYKEAVAQDKRTFIQYYWSLLKMKQLCIFTFYTYTDHTLRLVKIALFILFLSFYFAFTALFFNDSIMRAIYIYKGNTDAAVHVTNIVLSSLCCLIMNYIVRFVTLSERDINKIVNDGNEEHRKTNAYQTKQRIKIKTYILFVIAGLLIGLCWYYVAAFCAVFKNSQGHYFINVLVAFIVCNIWPCVTSLIAPIFRLKSIHEKNSECMYKFSQIIAYF